jgi:acyl-CoA dehydrogenase
VLFRSDILSYLYLASAVLKRYHDDGEPEADRMLVTWCCQTLFYETALAIEGIIANFPIRWARAFLRIILQPLGHGENKPTDALGHQLAHLLTEPNETRTRLTRLVFHEALINCPIGRLEEAFHRLCAVSDLEKKVITAVKKGLLPSLSFSKQIEEAVAQGILTRVEGARLKDAELARQSVIAVDDFHPDELSHPKPAHHSSLSE